MVNLIPPLLVHPTLIKPEETLSFKDIKKIYEDKNVKLCVLPIKNRYDSSAVNGNGLKCRLSHVKVRLGRIAPTAIVTWEIIVWRTEVCSSNSDIFAFVAPLRHLGGVADYLIASTA